MNGASKSTTCRNGGVLTLSFACHVLIVAALLAGIPQDGQGQAPSPRPIPTGVLGGVPMTPADSVTRTIVARLDFNSYKVLVNGLAQFGDREQGTERNARAVDWIEEQLRGWGYQAERLHYEYEGEPREQVYATKVGAAAPHEMYILGAHMDGRGEGQALNDNASGTALVMEIARVLAPPDIQTEGSVRFALWNNEETGLNGASVASLIECRIEPSELDPCVGCGELPIDACVLVVSEGLPRFDLASDHVDVVDSPVQTLRAEHVQLDFGHIQPASVLRGVDEIEAIP